MNQIFEDSTDVPLEVMTPNPEVTAKAKRRRFTGEYKRRILREADALIEIGGMGKRLRREGLCASHLSTWHRGRERGELEGLGPRKRDNSICRHPSVTRLGTLPARYARRPRS